MGMIECRREGPIALLGINRPDKRNALDMALTDEFAQILQQLRHEPTILIVHSTTPGMFVAGADISELLERDAEMGLRGVNASLFDALEAHRWPTIAAIDGPALGGGCELALACDLRVASQRSSFGQPELGLGILAGAGGNWRLAQAVGIPMARRMLYTGEILDGQRAHAAGLVDRLSSPDTVQHSALELAEAVSTRSWRALELTKIAMRLHRPATTLYDMTAQALLFEGEDKRTRMAAFLDERRRRRSQRAPSDFAG